MLHEGQQFGTVLHGVEAEQYGEHDGSVPLHRDDLWRDVLERDRPVHGPGPQTGRRNRALLQLYRGRFTLAPGSVFG